MPIADDPHPSSPDRPEPTGGDPFEGLLLDENFVHGAAVREPSARTRMLSAQWRLQEPVDPGGRRWSPHLHRTSRWSGWLDRRGRIALAVLCGLTALLGLASWAGREPPTDDRSAPPLPVAVRPSADAALPGGGIFPGGKCGTKGFHHFTLPPAAGSGRPGSPGPALDLGSYGFSSQSANDPGILEVGLLISPGPTGPLDLARPLGPEGVAVEIEGPGGLVGAAHHLPVTYDDDTEPTADGRLISPVSALVTFPVAALCPGYTGPAVARGLVPPVDAHNTITGPPRYTLHVSFSDPAVGALRRASGSPVAGDVLAADNLLHDEVSAVGPAAAPGSGR
ncbi:hypothetical protein OHV05_01105 [Kitasatospora sp. NBC_00070]|uniref:SCO2583/SCO2584 N-terminal domain-containing protein n=1 Tax=Kitasatospora sp. NBC_00070 TaxID=2975962 RepID=UPI0032434B3B